MARRTNRKVKPVHLVFSAHGDRNPYLNNPAKHLAKRIRTHVYESAYGQDWFNSPTAEDTAAINKDIFLRRTQEFLKRAQAGGQRIIAGESSDSVGQEKLIDLKALAEVTRRWAKRSASLADIKKMLKAYAEYDQYRHQLIIDKIRKSDKPLVARYGPAHSTLSAELRKEGIESSRDMQPRVFDWNLSLIRKLLSGKKPDDIPDIEYKKAFLAEFYADAVPFSLAILKPSPYKEQVITLFWRTLISRLREEQVDEIIKAKDRDLILTKNGLDRTPTLPEIKSFLEQHSEFYRRQLAGGRMKKEKK